MKILHIAPIGHVAEGIGTVLMHLVPEQIKLGNDVRVITIKDNKLYHESFIYSISDNNVFSDFINNWTPDVVIFHSVFHLSYIGFCKTLIRLGIPYLSQLHGCLSVENYKKSHIKKWFALKLMYAAFFKYASSIIYLNNGEYSNSIVKRYNPNKIIIPNGCSKLPGLEKKNKASSPVDILYMGRIDIIQKGNDFLVKALELLKGSKLNFHVRVYANPDDPDMPVFLDMIKDIKSIISYEGVVYGHEKYIRMQKADIFILTSRYEGMPMGILEALSFGIPCIVTPGTNMADVISQYKAGWVCDLEAKKIAETIKSAVCEYTSNPVKFRECALNLSLNYEWTHIAEESVSCYKRVIVPQS